MRQRLAWLALVALWAFGLHAVWESLHISLYTGYEGIFGPYPVWLVATLGDVLYTLIVVIVLAIFKEERSYGLLALAGLLVAVCVEYKAMLLGRWSYTAAMPTLFGFGLSPLLQMTLLLPLSVYGASKIIERLRRQ